MQNRHLHTEPAHELHVVLDDNQRVIFADLLQQIGGGLGFCVGHAGDWLVDEEELGVLRDEHADLEPLLLPVRKQAGQTLAMSGETDGFQDGADAGDIAVRAPE